MRAHECTARAVAILLAGLAVVPASAAQHEQLGVVAVAEPPGPGPELTELAHQLRLAAAERTGGVVSASDLRERMTGQATSATLAELDRAYAGALATYQSGDFEGSVRTLRAVVDDLARVPPGADAFAQWTRAMLRLARAEQTLGRGGEARELLERVVRANPAVKADPTQYPPSFVKQVEALRGDVWAAARRRLAVTASSKGARVFVEGREVGTAPLALELPPGRYRVAGTQGEVHVPAIVADLTEEARSVHLDLALAEALKPALGPGLALRQGDRARALVAAGGLLGVDKLLAAQLVTEAEVEYLTASYFDVRRGMLLREGRIRLARRAAPAPAVSALAGFLISGQPSALVAQTRDTEAPVDVPPGVKPLAPAPPAAPRGGPAQAAAQVPGPSAPVTGGHSVPSASGEETSRAPEPPLAQAPPHPAGPRLVPAGTADARHGGGGSRRTWAYVTGGAGLALLAGGAVAGLQARSALDAEKAATTIVEYDRQKSRARSRSTLADALFVAGGAGVATGAWLFFTSRPAPVALEVAPVTGGALASVSGGF